MVTATNTPPSPALASPGSGRQEADTDWRITTKIAKAEAEGRVWWSFEYFPPRTAQGLTNLYDRIERMADLGPAFVDITWNAGGRTSDLTAQLVKTVHTYIGLETCMHLTCTNMPRSKVDVALREAKEFGCRNILALRGDPPADGGAWQRHEAGFEYAKELVEYIREHYGDYFAIAVAGFPEGHPEAQEGRDLEMERLKEKIDAGADFIFTQMFYDYDIFERWVKSVRAAGITCPIVPGVMPIQTYGGYQRATARFRTEVPQYFHDALDPIKDDDAKVREVGTKLVGDMCRKIVDPKNGLGISGLHIYTMNLERGSRMLLDYLGLSPSVQQTKTLPWTPSLTPKRRDEGIRPIFWANRAKSYVDRTETWDEFPNGRWGDARSPAYGDVDAYGVKLRYSNTEAVELWGKPESLDNVRDLFTRFCEGKVKALPWSETGIAKETSVIDEKLRAMNRRGYLTINSQPAVDGARSDDPVHGWGPKHGYVYQKAYLEFFVAPDQVDALISRIERDPQMTYHVVNARGDMRTNTTSEAPCAVTWGCFPHQEIVQPTIVESISFLAWKDEAYEIGRHWARVYEEGSATRQLLEQLFDGWFLVNVVHNDFKNADAIFAPFLGDEAPAA
ncbi:putative MET13-putative methylene tetrahydrofolate reductase [Tilletiopsis washingtonensis]|uniref:Putative MET13-putative methylene tetrahydrofolate reductase n=1 Tax=Tilletiopsis washingtonensis TaxID=58919 RepID=A0A316Z188_9BASI|nr:putative MET13-putative methylene tetrahydrofolate reductase [Tilletiopsis washingtonensis]PWN94844.1 putative MET13-putative methylene tetrahydrofolate reductase [Tilletiopsis washingtonensis]